MIAALLAAPVAYAYAVYPALLAALSALAARGRPGRAPARPASAPTIGAPPSGAHPADSDLPTLDVVCVFHDEGETIVEKKLDLERQDYPRDRLRVLLVSDGSTDGADALVDALRLPRMGKSAALAEALRRCRGEIVVLTDADVRMDPGALRALAAPFLDTADPAVGAVVPRLVSEGAPAERLYAAYEDALRRLEAEAGTTVSTPGACFAVRRALVDEFFVGLLCEDLWIGLGVLARGARIAHAPDAVVRERSGGARREADRRRRIGRGNAQILLRLDEVWGRLSPFARFALASHKLLRWAAPFLLALSGAAALRRARPRNAAAAGLLLGAAVAQPALRHAAAVHLGLALGLVEGLLGNTDSTWTPRREKIDLDTSDGRS